MIRSRRNPQVRAIRRLRNSHARRYADLLLLEGRHLVSAAAEAGLGLDHLLVTPEFRAAHSEFVRQLEDRSGTVPALIHPDRLREQADADAPQGIAALAKLPAGWNTARDAGTRTLPVPPGLHLYVDGVQDPGNLGAMARSGEAAGAVSLLLAGGTTRPNHPRALRASAGSLLRIPVWTDVRVDRLRSNEVWLALAPPNKGAEGQLTTPLFAASNPGEKLVHLLAADRIVLAVGNESRGVSNPVLDRADMLLTVPTAGAVESLNAAVAASLALFELQRLRGCQPATDLCARSADGSMPAPLHAGRRRRRSGRR